MPELRGPEFHPSFMGIPTFLYAPYAQTAAELKEMGADIACWERLWIWGW